jgi:hypothetical protein
MAVTKETLKKHHFWILVGLTPLMVLIAVISISTGVGAAIEEKKKAIDKATADLRGKENPKSDAYLERYGKQIEVLGTKRTDLWKDNWERQIGLTTKNVGGKEVLVQDPSRNLMRWPNSPNKLLARFNYNANYFTDKNQLKFGERIPDELGEYDEFKKSEVYLAEFSNPYLKDAAREPEKRTGMADRIYPTAFAGGWQGVLRHVKAWDERKPTSEQLWLALEDIWVQRAMLDAIKSVNDQIGAFVRLPRPEDTNLDRTFGSRVWFLQLKVAPRAMDGRQVITGTLRNMTDRLQLLGTGNMMVLNVWLSSAPGATPIQFKIGGEFVPGGGVHPIVPSDDHVLPLGTTVEEIVKVEQVFDLRTVPIRRIERLALGYKDSRYSAVALKMPLFPAFEKEEKAAAAGASGGADSTFGGSGGGAPPGTGGGPPPGSSSKAPPGVIGSAGAGIGGGSGSSAAAGGPSEGGGDVATVLDGNRKRYLDPVTAQVRRMPVAITVVVDQAYMQDVLLAYANLPMRFQTTQMHWQRFRGNLEGSGSSGGGSGGENIGGPARGYTNEGGLKFGSSGGPPRGSAGGPPPGVSGSAGGPPPGITGAGPAMSGPGPGPGGPSMPGGGNLTSFSEGQITAGLVELTIYGIVSLYEKYSEEKPAEGSAGAKN